MSISKCLILSLLLSSFFFSCTESIDSLTEDYNSAFDNTTAPSEDIKNSESKFPNSESINDVNFNSSNMLSGIYTIRYYTTLCLIAPYGAELYEWTVTPVSECANKEEPQSFSLSKKQQLNLYVPNTALTVLKEYTLTLTVYAGDGSIYTDTATLWIVPA